MPDETELEIVKPEQLADGSWKLPTRLAEVQRLNRLVEYVADRIPDLEKKANLEPVAPPEEAVKPMEDREDVPATLENGDWPADTFHQMSNMVPNGYTVTISDMRFSKVSEAREFLEAMRQLLINYRK